MSFPTNPIHTIHIAWWKCRWKCVPVSAVARCCLCCVLPAEENATTIKIKVICLQSGELITNNGGSFNNNASKNNYIIGGFQNIRKNVNLSQLGVRIKIYIWNHRPEIRCFWCMWCCYLVFFVLWHMGWHPSHECHCQTNRTCWEWKLKFAGPFKKPQVWLPTNMLHPSSFSKLVFFPKIIFFIYFENSKVQKKMWKKKTRTRWFKVTFWDGYVTFWIWFCLLPFK